MLDRVPTDFVKWVAVELAGLVMVGLLILTYSRLAPGLEANRAAGPAGWVPAPAVATSVSAPAGVGKPGAAPRPNTTATAGSATTPATTGPSRHTVQPGETLSQIAERYGVSVDAIAAANKLQDRDNLKMGQELVIPAPGAPTPVAAPMSPAPPAPAAPAPAAPAPAPTEAAPAVTRYRVVPGDTLNSIAQQFGVSTADLIQANNLANGDDIRIDQELIIPSH
ncbi:MAG: LysM peptidoglycan-binding domain-containing protein [Bacteroidetes bacterium]|nr:LysM peptidoglycan-binding domain-containing protein [Bacteroidota bacterium]